MGFFKKLKKGIKKLGKVQLKLAKAPLDFAKKVNKTVLKTGFGSNLGGKISDASIGAAQSITFGTLDGLTGGLGSTGFQLGEGLLEGGGGGGGGGGGYSAPSLPAPSEPGGLGISNPLLVAGVVAVGVLGVVLLTKGRK